MCLKASVIVVLGPYSTKVVPTAKMICNEIKE
jgi:hypothetical protein